MKQRAASGSAAVKLELAHRDRQREETLGAIKLALAATPLQAYASVDPELKAREIFDASGLSGHAGAYEEILAAVKATVARANSPEVMAQRFLDAERSLAVPAVPLLLRRPVSPSKFSMPRPLRMPAVLLFPRRLLAALLRRSSKRPARTVKEKEVKMKDDAILAELEALKTRVAALEANAGLKSVARIEAPAAPVPEEGVRIYYPPDPNPFVMPNNDELKILRAIAHSKYPNSGQTFRIILMPTGPSSSFSRNFPRYSYALKLCRLDKLNKKVSCLGGSVKPKLAPAAQPPRRHSRFCFLRSRSAPVT